MIHFREVKKEAAALNDEALNHWQTEHVKLLDSKRSSERLDGLSDIPTDVQYSSNDDEEEKVEVEGAEAKQPRVNDEHEEQALPPSKISWQRQSSIELRVYSEDELGQFRRRVLVSDSEYLDGGPKKNKEREEEFTRCAKDLEQITEARDAQKHKYDTLRKQRLDKFLAGLNLISLKLKEMYQHRIHANYDYTGCMPPKKSWKNISNVSGGEKVSIVIDFVVNGANVVSDSEFTDTRIRFACIQSKLALPRSVRRVEDQQEVRHCSNETYHAYNTNLQLDRYQSPQFPRTDLALDDHG
ncbi:hypothetical protein EDD16DRAFT_1529164 [Pisolithus croceorrhizus]|nr:hypothetical protein EDD16DRAFT_1529164 [Pisolithus croceorrhizus]KAI6159268.1 hypothetical protein EDD17DRAFT_1511403 [Pisolithus thermaeus]